MKSAGAFEIIRRRTIRMSKNHQATGSEDVAASCLDEALRRLNELSWTGAASDVPFRGQQECVLYAVW